MKYGAIDNSTLETPPAEPVEWVGWDITMPNEFNQKVTVKSKDWFTARVEIAKILHPSSIDNLKVEKILK